MSSKTLRAGQEGALQRQDRHTQFSSYPAVLAKRNARIYRKNVQYRNSRCKKAIRAEKATGELRWGIFSMLETIVWQNGRGKEETQRHRTATIGKNKGEGA